MRGILVCDTSARRNGAYSDTLKSRIRNFYIIGGFRAHGFEKEGSFRADEVKKGGFGGWGTYPFCLTMRLPPLGL